ncbi:MAG: hypothetical protein Q9168_005350 [Polycauliona sp. 1 TL-2023]
MGVCQKLVDIRPQIQSPGDLANYFALAPEQLTDWAQIALEVRRRDERADKARSEQVRAQYPNTARQEVLTRDGYLRANWGDSYLQNEAQQSPTSVSGTLTDPRESGIDQGVEIINVLGTPTVEMASQDPAP